MFASFLDVITARKRKKPIPVLAMHTPLATPTDEEDFLFLPFSLIE